MSRLRSLAHRAARATGHELVRHHFYSPLPHDTPPEAWRRRSPMAGIDFDLDAQLAWFEETCRAAAGWTPPPSTMYGVVDATVLYGVMRSLNPNRVVELGSGVSSNVIVAARERPHDIYDPVANDRTDLNVHRVSASNVPQEVFEELEAGDVLFVDTTHTVKVGGDVNRIILDALPALAPGVVVHVHDIFLPYEYPEHWWTDFRRLWTEQYLLQAFLIGNTDWEVLCSCHAMIRDFPDRVAGVVPGFTPPGSAGAFWMRRRS
jgi:hypothetical protein